ncbi:MAG: RDD family protein [Oligoflexia bacterium]|nr:RDD family protein [Oligoflexia bacterium]
MNMDSPELNELDDLTEEHLGFSALSEGLGFQNNPKITDSNTAKPATKSSTYQGSAATLAGTVKYSYPIHRDSKTNTNSTSNVANNTASVQDPGAPLVQRFFAFAIDIFMVGVPCAFAWKFSFGAQAVEIFSSDIKTPLSLFAAILFTSILISESFGGQTLGKMILGLRVVEDDKYQKPTGLKHAVLRMILFTLGTTLGFLGLLASFWDKKRRPWHDKYSGSIVRKIS